jgi:hypothetical protein
MPVTRTNRGYLCRLNISGGRHEESAARAFWFGARSFSFQGANCVVKVWSEMRWRIHRSWDFILRADLFIARSPQYKQQSEREREIVRFLLSRSSHLIIWHQFARSTQHLTQNRKPLWCHNKSNTDHLGCQISISLRHLSSAWLIFEKKRRNCYKNTD